MEPQDIKQPLPEPSHPWPQPPQPTPPPYQYYPEATASNVMNPPYQQAVEQPGSQQSWSQGQPQRYQQTWQQPQVIVVQPQPIVQPVQRPFDTQYGIGALILAISVTFIIVFFGCWIGLLCSVAGIAFALYANSQAQSGKMASAKCNQLWSIICSVCSIGSFILVVAAIIIYIVIITTILY